MKTTTALLMAWAVLPVQAEGDAAELGTVMCSGSAEELELDLSRVWDIRDLSPIRVAYSACGWTLEPTATARTVTLQLEPLEGGQVVVPDGADGLSGQGAYDWNPEGMVSTRQYVLTHLVKSGSTPVAGETLKAVFSFEHCVVEAPLEELRAALLGVGQACGFDNDQTNKWKPVGGAGEGLVAPSGAASALTFAFHGAGTFAFEWKAVSGGLAATLDGEDALAVSGPSDWSQQAVVVSGWRDHQLLLSASGDGAGIAVRNVRWLCSDQLCAKGDAEGIRMDLREGVRIVRKERELLPFAYSVTNFTGLAGVTASSVVRVRVVRIDGEGDDYLSWSEVPGTERILADAADEGAVVWPGKNGGFWKAEFTVANGDEPIHQETAIFDMRKFGLGLVLLLQ